MCMFDWVRCEAPLPDPPGEKHSGFQTKDLDCSMDTYRITVDGRLELEKIVSEPVPEAERPPPPGPEASIFEKLQAIGGYYREVSRSWVDQNHHGYLKFYTSTSLPSAEGRPTYNWHEYRAKFTDGRLVEIVKIHDARP